MAPGLEVQTTQDAEATSEQVTDSSALLTDDTLAQYEFKTVTSYDADTMVHDVVKDWITKVQPKQKSFEMVSDNWYQSINPQRKLREKHTVILNAVKHAAEFHGKEIIKYAKEVDDFWNDTRQELNIRKGKATDIDHVCRHAAKDKDETLKDFDAVKKCIMKRRADEAVKSKEKAMKRSRTASSNAPDGSA